MFTKFGFNYFFFALGTLIGSIYFILGEGSILIAGIVCLVASSAIFTSLTHRKAEILSLLTAILLVFFNYNIRSEAIEYQDVSKALQEKNTYLQVISSPKDSFFRSNYLIELRHKDPDLKTRLIELLVPTRFVAHSNSAKAIQKGDIVKLDSSPELEKISAKKISFYKKDKVYYEIKKPEAVFSKTASSSIDKLQSKIKQYYYSSLSSDNAGIVTSLLFGARDGDIPEKLLSLSRKLGLGHFFAASGFHLLVLTLVLGWLLNLLRVKDPVNSLLLILGSFIYAGLAGFSPSIVRAGIFVVTYVSLKLLKRKAWSIKFLFLLTGTILLIDPFTIFDIGFQLSYLATLSLMLWAKIIEHKFAAVKIPKYLKDIITVSISVQIMLLPLVIYYFNSMQIWSLIANLIFTPLLSLVIVLSFFGLSFILEPLLNLIKYLIYKAEYLPYLNSHLEIDLTSMVILLIFFNAAAYFIFGEHSKEPVKFNLDRKYDEKLYDLLRAILKNSYTLTSVILGSFILITAVNMDPIGMKKLVIDNGRIINQNIPDLSLRDRYRYFDIYGKKALVINDRSSLKRLNPLLNEIKEVDILFLPNLRASDVYLGRLCQLINPQFIITSTSSKDPKVIKNIELLGQKSHIILNEGLVYISKEKFWSLKK